MSVVIVRFDDSADFADRVTFWDGKRFVAEYPNAREYPSDRIAVVAFDLIAAEPGREIALVENYGQIDETTIDRK